MTITSFFFHLTFISLCGSALLVVTSRNLIHSILFLIICFLKAVVIFIFMGAECLGWILGILYIGAVAILFLFIMMMIHSDTTPLIQTTSRWNKSISAIIGLSIWWELCFLIIKSPTPSLMQGVNLIDIGNVLYTAYFFPFHILGMILLITLVGALILTKTPANPFLKRQSPIKQLQRSTTLDLHNTHAPPSCTSPKKEREHS